MVIKGGDALYSADLAYIHDAGFSWFAKRAGPEIVRILHAHGIHNPSAGSGRAARIVEVGCGGGILARQLVDAGYDVIGLDRSPAMLRVARARVPEATFRVATLTRAAIPRCDAVIAIGEVVSYVPTSLRPFFERVHDALAPGGLFIFDFMESAKRRTYSAKSFGGDDWEIIFKADVDAAGRTLTRRMTMFRKVGKRYRRSRETHRVRLRSRQDVRTMLAEAGFAVILGRSYGRYRLLPGDVTVIAKKRQ